jgi:hypothetical protein
MREYHMQISNMICCLIIDFGIEVCAVAGALCSTWCKRSMKSQCWITVDALDAELSQNVARALLGHHIVHLERMRYLRLYCLFLAVFSYH